MKYLKNKRVKFELESGKKCSYADLLIHCLDVTPEGGYDRKEMKIRDKLETIILKCNGNFKFENSDAEELQRIVEIPRWLTRDKEVEQFRDDVAEMEETK